MAEFQSCPEQSKNRAGYLCCNNKHLDWLPLISQCRALNILYFVMDIHLIWVRWGFWQIKNNGRGYISVLSHQMINVGYITTPSSACRPAPSSIGLPKFISLDKKKKKKKSIDLFRFFFYHLQLQPPPRGGGCNWNHSDSFFITCSYSPRLAVAVSASDKNKIWTNQYSFFGSKTLSYNMVIIKLLTSTLFIFIILLFHFRTFSV